MYYTMFNQHKWKLNATKLSLPVLINVRALNLKSRGSVKTYLAESING